MVTLAVICVSTLATVPGSSATRALDKQENSLTTTKNGIETTRNEDGSLFEVDTTGKGAVLCVWGLYEVVEAVGQACHASEDTAFRAEVKRSIMQTDEFILHNSAGRITKDGLAARRIEGLKDLKAIGPLCTGQAAELYSAFRNAGDKALRRGTDDLLSIPRKPVMNPCL